MILRRYKKEVMDDIKKTTDCFESKKNSTEGIFDTIFNFYK